MLATINKKDRPNLIETAIRYGVPMDKVQQMSYKSLSHVVAAGAYFAIWLVDCLNSTNSAVFERGEKDSIRRQLLELLQFSQYYLTEVPRVNKQLWTYTQGLIHLALLFFFGAEDERTQQWIQWFGQLGVTPQLYKYKDVQHPITVYIKSPADVSEQSHYFVQRPMFYIGSTKVGVCHREYNRHTQLNRYKKGKAIQVELAIRWWASENNYSQFSTIAVKHFDTYEAAWTYEHALIEQLQAPLNHPLISKHLTRNAFRYFYKPEKRRLAGIESRHRLFRRIRRRTTTLQESYGNIATLRLDTWSVMYKLASYTQQRFLTSKQLRSGQYTDTMIYGFIRLSAHVEEPERSRIRSELKNIAKFRNMTWPMMTDKPLQIPFLAHPDFARTTKRWLKRYIRSRKHNAIPFHLPKGTVREAAHSKVADILYNLFSWEEHDLSQPDQLPCPCKELLKTNPGLENIDGHICGTLEQLKLPPALQLLSHMNSYSTVFPTKQNFIEATTGALQKWLKKHGYPSHDTVEFPSFLQEQWSIHLQALKQVPRLTVDHISQLKAILGEQVVIHHADHQNQNARIFCPQLYFQGCNNTWNDPQLFSKLEMSSEEALTRVQKLATRWIQDKYKWGIKWGARLPQGFIFLKGKKQYKKGRTIISYKGSTFATLLKYAATALEAMLKQVWPQSLGQFSTPEIWQAVHTFFQKTDPQIDLHTLNDDLIGFFNSVPQQKLLQAVQVLVRDWRNIWIHHYSSGSQQTEFPPTEHYSWKTEQEQLWQPQDTYHFYFWPAGHR